MTCIYSWVFRLAAKGEWRITSFPSQSTSYQPWRNPQKSLQQEKLRLSLSFMMINASDNHWKWSLSRDYASPVITGIIKLLEPDTQTANSILFILCPAPMTATSHHALQLAHAAGMLSALVHNEQAATGSRTWGRGEELFGEASHSLAVAKETSSFLWEDPRPASFTPPLYQPHFTCKKTKEKLRQLLTSYRNACNLYI